MFDWDIWCFLFCVLPKLICYGSFVKFRGDWKSVGQWEKAGGRLRWVSIYFKMFSSGNRKFLISPGFCLCFLVFLNFYIIFFLYFEFIVSFLCFPIANGIIINVALLIMLKLVFPIFFLSGKGPLRLKLVLCWYSFNTWVCCTALPF